MDERLENVSCAICDGNDAAVFCGTASGTRFVRCRHDGLLYMNPRPTSRSLRQFHTGFVRDDNIELFGPCRRKELARAARAIRAIKPGGKLLDVGCATGALFEHFAGDAAWKLWGVDPCLLGAEKARAAADTEVFCGALSEAAYPPGFFDAVTILDALYYSVDPASELRETHRVLKHDGLLAVEIPGFTYSLVRERGPLCWLLDRRWKRGFASTRHLYYFAPANFELLLQKAGFRVIRMIPGQASLARKGFSRFLNDLHFALTRLLFRLSAGRVSIAGKELYLAVKCSPRPESMRHDP